MTHFSLMFHDDVIIRKHFSRYWLFVCGEFTSLRWIPLIKASDAELWYFIWSAPEKKNNWVKNREACDLKRHHVHYSVTAMLDAQCSAPCLSVCLSVRAPTLVLIYRRCCLLAVYWKPLGTLGILEKTLIWNFIIYYLYQWILPPVVSHQPT